MSQVKHDESLEDVDPAILQQEIMSSFRNFEASFRREHPVVWMITLLLPPVLTSSILVGLALVEDVAHVRTVVIAACAAFFVFGRFSIPLVDNMEWIELSKEHMFVMITYMDLMVALIVPFHIGFLFRLKGIGPKISALVADGQFILSRNAWMKRASFLGLVLFVTFPLAATGSIGGAIFSRLLGMSRLASILGIAIGSLIGNGVMYLFADLFARHIGQDNPIVKYGGVAMIILIVIVLERRYRSAKKRFLAARQSTEKPANSGASTDATPNG